MTKNKSIRKYAMLLGNRLAGQQSDEDDAAKSGKEYAITIFKIISNKKNQGESFTWDGAIESFKELCVTAAELSYQGKQNLIDIASKNAENKFIDLVAQHQNK